MRIKVYFALGILSFYKDVGIVCGKSVVASDPSIQRDFETYMNCSRVMASSDCLEITGAIEKIINLWSAV